MKKEWEKNSFEWDYRWKLAFWLIQSFFLINVYNVCFYENTLTLFQ